jgi:hypothetical protein
MPSAAPRPSAPSSRQSLTLESLPAEEGDCLLLTCRSGRRRHHVLIDGGTPRTAVRLRERLAALPGRRVDLLVVTHIDTDHIGGIVRLLREPDLPVEFGDVWFNGFRHLPRNALNRPRGLKDAEELSAVLTGSEGRSALPWNLAFGGAAVMRAATEGDGVSGTLPSVSFPWGLKLTILSPTPQRLDALHSGWASYLAALHTEKREPATPNLRRRGVPDLDALAAAPSKEDTSAPNGSSIALLAEFAGRRVLLAADAFCDVLCPALRSLRPDKEKRLHVDILKLPHHGSQANVLQGFLDAVRADHYLISTNGDRFNHPDDEAMARVITQGGPGHSLWFNYRCARTMPWSDARWTQKYGYATRYPASGAEGIALTLDGR